MSKPVVLITSATSQNGTQAAWLLLAEGKCTLRLAARDPSKLSAFATAGVQTIALDPTNADSITQACTGVDVVYLILPSLVGVAAVTMFNNFLQAMKAKGVKHVVYLSAIDAAPADNKDYKPIHNHGENEQMLQKSGIPFTFVRPTWFHENQVRYHSQSIKHTGEFRTSAGDGVWTSVAVQDIAAAAALVLSDPAKHARQTYTLTTDAVTDPMIADMISKVTGQKVRHVNLTPEEHTEMPEEHTKMMVKVYGGTEIAKERAKIMVALDFEKRMSFFSKVHPDLEQLLGHKGISLQDFLTQHAEAFRQP